MLGRKWHVPLGMAICIHLVILGVIIILKPQQVQTEFLEITLAECYTSPTVGVTEIREPQSTASVVHKFTAEKSFASVSARQPIDTSEVVIKEEMSRAQTVHSGLEGDKVPVVVQGTLQETDTQHGGMHSFPGLTSAPIVLRSEESKYPNAARQYGWGGTVKLRVLVSDQGVVENVQVSSSSNYSQLDQAAVSSMYGWKFKAAFKDGEPVAVWVIIPVTFKLE